GRTLAVEQLRGRRHTLLLRRASGDREPPRCIPPRLPIVVALREVRGVVIHGADHIEVAVAVEIDGVHAGRVGHCLGGVHRAAVTSAAGPRRPLRSTTISATLACMPKLSTTTQFGSCVVARQVSEPFQPSPFGSTHHCTATPPSVSDSTGLLRKFCWPALTHS